MREPKFRAIGLDMNRDETGWIYGDVYYRWDVNDIRPETLSEYTGLKDKNGKESYNGDEVRVRYGKHHNEPKGITRNGIVVWSDKDTSFMIAINDSKVMVSFSIVVEFLVFGNIYQDKQ